MVANPFNFDVDADAYLDAMHDSNPVASRRLEATLDALEISPTDPSHRTHRLEVEGGSVWGIRVAAGVDEFMILWTHLPGEAGAAHGVFIAYVGPNTLL